MTYKSIFTAGVARYLLKLGNPIYDIKADKKNKDKTNGYKLLEIFYQKFFKNIPTSIGRRGCHSELE